VYTWDRLRFALFRAWRGRALKLGGPVSPNLRRAHIRIEPGGRIDLGRGVTTERQGGNRIFVQANGRLSLAEDVWLRTDQGENRLTVYPGARIEIGPRTLLNGAMIVAKEEVVIGADSQLAFGVRIFDSDLHDLDRDTPERREPVRIGARVWIGSDVTILRGVTIGDDTVVGSQSLVTRDLPSRVIAVGSPAKPLRSIASREGCR
jgi:maltose O-acetyltransferase